LRLSGCPVEGIFSVHPRGRPRGELQEAESGAERGAAAVGHGSRSHSAATALMSAPTATARYSGRRSMT
jgi:hypothetical protein